MTVKAKQTAQSNHLYVVYLLRCSDGSLYCGITNSLSRRLESHRSGKGSKYTRSRLPVTLVGATPALFTNSQALKIERSIKRLRRPEDKVKFFRNGLRD